MSTHNIGFYEDLTKNTFELSSNTHLVSSAELHLFVVLYSTKESIFTIELRHEKTCFLHMRNQRRR